MKKFLIIFLFLLLCMQLGGCKKKIDMTYDVKYDAIYTKTIDEELGRYKYYCEVIDQKSVLFREYSEMVSFFDKNDVEFSGNPRRYNEHFFMENALIIVIEEPGCDSEYELILKRNMLYIYQITSSFCDYLEFDYEGSILKEKARVFIVKKKDIKNANVIERVLVYKDE